MAIETRTLGHKCLSDLDLGLLGRTTEILKQWLNLTNEQIAREADVDPHFVERIISGKHRTLTKSIPRLALWIDRKIISAYFLD